MKQLLINIFAYDHHAKFEILAEDNAKAVELAILDKLGLDFEVVAPEINEARRENESPIDLVARLSKEKAMAVAKSKTGLIIASDQVATLDSGENEDDVILTKPGSHENAFLQLKKSSGKTVNFLTGLVLMNANTLHTQLHVEHFKVTFKILSDNQILNLGPFEVRFNENRPFFIEGTDLFQIGGLFYSRRIGSSPYNQYEIFNDLKSGEYVSGNR